LFAGCVDTGIGNDQLNKLLSAVNLPIIHRNTMATAENRFHPAILQTAQESCTEVIALDKKLASAGTGD